MSHRHPEFREKERAFQRLAAMPSWREEFTEREGAKPPSSRGAAQPSLADELNVAAAKVEARRCSPEFVFEMVTEWGLNALRATPVEARQATSQRLAEATRAWQRLRRAIWSHVDRWTLTAKYGRTLDARQHAARHLTQFAATLSPPQHGKREAAVNHGAILHRKARYEFRLGRALLLLGGTLDSDPACVGRAVGLPQARWRWFLGLWIGDTLKVPPTVEQAAVEWTRRDFGLSEGTVERIVREFWPRRETVIDSDG